MITRAAYHLTRTSGGMTSVAGEIYKRIPS
jgi:hypothetical protein